MFIYLSSILNVLYWNECQTYNYSRHIQINPPRMPICKGYMVNSANSPTDGRSTAEPRLIIIYSKKSSRRNNSSELAMFDLSKWSCLINSSYSRNPMQIILNRVAAGDSAWYWDSVNVRMFAVLYTMGIWIIIILHVWQWGPNFLVICYQPL